MGGGGRPFVTPYGWSLNKGSSVKYELGMSLLVRGITAAASAAASAASAAAAAALMCPVTLPAIRRSEATAAKSKSVCDADDDVDVGIVEEVLGDDPRSPLSRSVGG